MRICPVEEEWMRGGSLGAVALGTLAVIAVAVAPQAQEPLRLRVAYVGTPVHLVPLLPLKREILKHYGTSYVSEAVRFRGSAPQITALAAGELEIANFGFSSFGLAIENAHMADLRVIADGHRDGVGAYFSNRYVVRADSEIRTVEDLKGKIVATNGIGGAADMGMRKMLRDHGLEEKRDYRIVEVEFPNMTAALREKKIDLGPLTQPFAYLAEKEGGLRVLFTLKDAMGENQTTLMAARTPFIAAHRQALVDFFEDMQRFVHWFIDPANRSAALALVAKFTKEPVSDFAPWLNTQDDNYRDPNLRPNLAALQRNLDAALRLGYVKTAVDVGGYADLSMVDEAAERLR